MKKVSLHIYDLCGKLVEDLSKRAGKTNRVVWNSAKCRPGVYLVKMAARNKIIVKKMVIIN